MSSSASTAASASSGKNHLYQLHSIPVCAVIAADRKKLEITRTNEIPTAKPPPYSQPPTKPARGPRPAVMYV